MFLEHATNAEYYIFSAEAEAAEEERKHVFEVCNARLKFAGEVEDFCQGITEVVYCQTKCPRKDECYELFNEWCRLGGEDPKSKILELARLKDISLKRAERFSEELERKEAELKNECQPKHEEGRLF